MKKIVAVALFLFFLTPAFVWAQMTRAEYIEQYKDMAIREMKRSGIPASITMAQAMLESDNGNSKLARRAKNHFGIKCGGVWNGKTFHQDDDARNECFRKYKDVEESYRDHSDFLQKKRYEKLFDLAIDDYKGWAKGLKKAGYATNPKYPALLIRIIEDNNLQELDKEKPRNLAQKTEKKPKANPKSESKGDIDSEFTIGTKEHQVKLNNRVKYIVVKAGDTFKSLNAEFDLMAWQLPKYNELPKNADLEEGQVLYLQPKRKKAEHGNNHHKVEKGETMYEISQKYAIKLRRLYQLNLMPEGTQAKPGTKLSLRKPLK